MKLVTIIIINYNSADDTIQLVKSIKNQACKNYNTLIIDNNSPKQDEMQKLKTIQEKNLLLMKSNQNTGLTGAVNFAVNQIKTPYTLLLNPDITLEKNAIKNLLETIQKDNKAFCVGGAIYHKDKIYAQGGKFNFITGIAKPLTPSAKTRKLKKWEYVDACMLLFNTDIFRKLRYDEKFFMYAETEDIILRAMKKGFTVYSNPKAVCYHKIYGSTGYKKSQFTAYYLARNKFLFLKKHLSGINYLKFLILNLLIISPLQIINFIFKNQISLIPAFIKGTINGIKTK